MKPIKLKNGKGTEIIVVDFKITTISTRNQTRSKIFAVCINKNLQLKGYSLKELRDAGFKVQSLD